MELREMAMKGGALHSPQRSSISRASPAVSYSGHVLPGRSYSSAVMQLVYLTTPKLNSSGTIQLKAEENKKAQLFPKRISPKVNAGAQLEFELAMISQSSTLATA